jgi:cytochrome b561
MAARNSLVEFGSVAKTLHWLVAGFFLFSYATAYYAILFTVDGTLANDIVVQLHITLGLLVTLPIVARLYWRLASPRPALPPGSPFMHGAAKVVHGALYGFMVLMPVTGYLGTFRDAEYLGLTNFGDTRIFAMLAERLDTTWEAFEVPMDFLHRDFGGGGLLWMLIAAHVTAVAYHELGRRDGTLQRMLPRRRRRATVPNEAPSR